MSRRGENIYKRKDGRWEGRYVKNRLNGKIKYGYVYAKTYKEVKFKLSEALENNSMSSKQKVYMKKHFVNDSFSIIAEEWIESLKVQLKESSIVKYRNILYGYLFPTFEHKRILDITRDDIIMFSNKLLISVGVKGNALSPKTVTITISVLKNILEYASQVKNYPVIDMRGISIKQSQKPMRILSRVEQQKLSQYLYENLTLCNLGILICLYTGLRIGEICALKWEDIFSQEQYLYVHQTMQRLQKEEKSEKKTKVLISEPKSECSIRKVPIPDEIFQLVNRFQYSENAYFLTGRVHKYIEPRTMQNRFKTVAKNCGISDANFHVLRHTFATRCVELGFDVKSLSEILGHANVNITLNRYVHPSMELKQKNMNMLSDLFIVK